MADPIRFYFDFSSPYGYLATFRIEALAAAHGRTVDWNAHLLGVAMKITGQGPLLNQPMRGAYATHDMTRMAREFGAPIVMPEVFPLHSVAASRAFYWLKGKNPEQAVAFVHRIYQAYWAQGRDMRAPEAVAAEADAMGLDGGALREALATDDAKQRLREAVDQAIERGIFGSPMFDIDGELFWGCDKFGQMDRWLKNGGW